MPALILADAIPPQPWRNGGGATRELLAWPAGSDWQLRISLADIDRDGPFSAFPGVQRHFAVLQGAGVRLQLAGQTLALTPESAALSFDGALAPGCELIAGPTRDLNLMLRGLAGTLTSARSSPSPDAAEMAEMTELDKWPWRALFCAGAARLRLPQAELALAPRSLLHGLPPGPLHLQLLDPAPAFWIGAAAGPACG